MEQGRLTPKTSSSIFADARMVVAGLAVFFSLALAASLFGLSLIVPVSLFLSAFAAYLLFRNPLLLLASVVIIRMSLDYSSQFITVSFFEHTFSLSQLLGVGIAGLGILLIFTRRRALSRFPLLFPYGLLIFWGLGTLLYSIAPGASAQEVLRIFDLFVIALMAYVSVERYRDYRFLLMAILISSALPILFGIYQFTFGIGLSDENVSAIRIFGTFSHPNVFSLYLFTVAAVASIYFLVYARQDRARLITGLSIGLILLTLLLTYARIAWVSLFVFALLVALWRYRFLLLPLILLPLVLTVFVPAVNQRITEAFHPTPDSSIVWRQNLWHDMLLKTDIEDRELFGSGLDTFRVSSEELRGERFGSNESHNDFVKFYVDGGITGLAVFTLYLASFVFPAVKARRLTPSHSLKNMATLLLLLVLTLTIASLSDNVFKNTPVQWILAIVMGGFIALYHATLPPELRIQDSGMNRK